eukprot:Rhum_TRINITY_DN14632_c13_g1::Rhum_TRINITY_DN14632_c13_g1_i1::g.106446::m.106446
MPGRPAGHPRRSRREGTRRQPRGLRALVVRCVAFLLRVIILAASRRSSAAGAPLLRPPLLLVRRSRRLRQRVDDGQRVVRETRRLRGLVVRGRVAFVLLLRAAVGGGRAAATVDVAAAAFLRTTLVARVALGRSRRLLLLLRRRCLFVRRGCCGRGRSILLRLPPRVLHEPRPQEGARVLRHLRNDALLLDTLVVGGPCVLGLLSLPFSVLPRRRRACGGGATRGALGRGRGGRGGACEGAAPGADNLQVLRGHPAGGAQACDDDAAGDDADEHAALPLGEDGCPVGEGSDCLHFVEEGLKACFFRVRSKKNESVRRVVSGGEGGAFHAVRAIVLPPVHPPLLTCFSVPCSNTGSAPMKYRYC